MTDPGSSSTFTETRRAPRTNVRHPATDSTKRLAYSLAPSPGPFPSTRSTPSSSRQGSVTSISSHSNRRMLPSHPSTLPHFYASEASVSGDESDRDGQDAEEDRIAYAIEKKKRDEARQRRRAKQAALSSSILNRDGTSTSLPGSPARRKSGMVLQGSELVNGGREQRNGKSELEGLGFEMGLPETDYQVLVDEAAFQAHPSRNQPATTYSSSLGSAVPSPDQSPSAFPSRSRRRSRQMSEVSYVNEDQQKTPRITVHEIEPAEETETNHVRFGEVNREPERERRSRPRPVSTAVPLDADHIVFPDTLPPPFPPAASEPSAQQGPTSPASSSFFSRRIVPSSPSKTNNRPPSVNSSHHGIGSYGSSAGSVASQSSLQLVLDDPIPVSPHFKSPSGRSTRSRGRSNSSHSAEESPTLADITPRSPNSRSARQARKPMGPTTIVGEMLAQQDPSRLYFPSPSLRTRPESTASSERSPPLSIISSVFPPRPRPSPYLNGAASPATSSSSRLPFPPPPASSKSNSSLVFPSPPAPTSPPRFGRSRYAPRPPPSPSVQNGISNSTSFASTLSTMSAQSVEQPVFPTLGAQLSSDGVVRSGIMPRRVSGMPWEKNGGESSTKGDELDRMMAAQRTAVSDEESVDVNEARLREQEKERKRRNIYNELIRTKTSDSLAGDEELDSFQRELLARDTVKKSLGAPLMSDAASKAPSDGSDHEDAESTGITPSTSTSSDISTLPSFPDVPTHTYHLSPSASAATVDDPDQVEVVLSDESSAVPSPITPTFSYSYHPTTPPKANPVKRAQRISLTSSSTSDQSHYEDAQEDPSRASVDEGSREQQPMLELSKQQTSLWVLDTLASTVSESQGRPLSDIGETEEPVEEVPKTTSPQLPPPVGTAESKEPVVSAPPSNPSLPSQSPSMAAVQRCDSPTFSQRSRSTASSAPISYTAPKRHPVASAAPLKTKTTFGKKITSLFGGGGASYNAAALGLRGSGISSRDFVSLERSSKDPSHHRNAVLPSKPSSELSFNRPSSETHSHSHSRSHSHSSSSYSTFPPVPTTPSSFSNATFGGTPRSSAPSTTSESNSGANNLADLLSKFEKEDKARFKGIAESRLGKSSSNVVVV